MNALFKYYLHILNNLRSRTALNGVILILAAHERTTLDVPIPETMNATLFADLFLNYLANLQMPSQQLKKKQMLWMIKIYFFFASHESHQAS
jgi:hypothetical protein